MRTWYRESGRAWTGMLSLLSILTVMSSPSFAMIEGGTGNSPIKDPGWPTGAAPVFNWPTRVAWWVGPPFGGGQWHAECKGDAQVLNAVLVEFARIDVAKKRLIVRDGIGYSFWLDPNGKKRGDRNTKIDWNFVIWEKARWNFQKQLPPDITALRSADDKEAPVAEIEVFTASIRWSDVNVPPGIEVLDMRLEAHGFTKDDGRVIEGIVTDADSSTPLPATVRAERIVAKPTGGYDYLPAEETISDDQGRWYFKNFPDQWSRIVVEAPGYAPRVIHHVRYDLQAGWERVDTSLLKSASMSGQVVDDAGKPVADARLLIRGLTGAAGNYDSPSDLAAISDPAGEFTFENLPTGRGVIRGHHDDYVQPGLGTQVEIPTTGVEINLIKSCQLIIQVEFANPRTSGYIVRLVPEGGEKVGSWGGSSNLDEQDRVHFKHIPPGVYVLSGRPNPGSDSQETEPVRIELKGGQKKSVKLQAVP